MRKCKNFEKMLLSVIDESMKQIFGESTAKSIYHYLENDYSLKYSDILKNLKSSPKAWRRFSVQVLAWLRLLS